jgi:flagellar basal-body rod modification protein FlgD
MTTVSGTSNTTSNTSATGTDRTTIAGDFTQFLSLLTTQLQNQSPLDPLDTNQFTQQLVQFASVEQQLKTNDTLTSLLTSTQASTTANAASYIGLSITADGSKSTLSGGQATWPITTSKAATKATVTIKDANGAIVTTKSTTLAAGSQQFVWNGKGADGNAVPDGEYTLSVAGTDASGQAITASTDVSGTVDAVDVTGASPVLTVAGINIPLQNVKTVATAATK